MSVLSMIRRGRQAAKEHSAKKAEQEMKEQAKPPYKHVPTHAAIDAMASAPTSVRELDRSRILEENRRRSAMTASGLGMSGVMSPAGGRMTPNGRMTPSGMMTPGSMITPSLMMAPGMMPPMPRIPAALSTASFASGYGSNSTVSMPAPTSYSMQPAWIQQGELDQSIPAPAPSPASPEELSSSNMSSKGKEVERVVAAEVRRDGQESRERDPLRSCPVDPMATTENPLSGSQDQEESDSQPTGAVSIRNPNTSVLMAGGGQEHLHRLHPSQTRRTSTPDGGYLNYYPPQARSSYSSSRLASTRASAHIVVTSAGIPPVPALPALQLGSMLPGSAVSSSTVSNASSNTLTTLVPSSTKTTPPPSTRAVAAAMDDSAIDCETTPQDDPEAEAETETPIPIGAAITTQSPSPTPQTAPTVQARRASKARFADDTAPGSPTPGERGVVDTAELPRSRLSRTRTNSAVSMAGVRLPTTFANDTLPVAVRPAQSSQNNNHQQQHQQQQHGASGGNKLTKPSPNTGKKRRWSLKPTKPTVVGGYI